VTAPAVAGRTPGPGEALAPPTDGEVHVWHVAFADMPDDLEAMAAVLDEPERARAQRFVFPDLARRWTFGRIALRRILAAYAAAPASELAFGTGERGKPYLIGADGAPAPLEFNMSHAKEHALIAVAWRQEIGVDIEGGREMTDADAIVQRNFSALERAAYYRLEPAHRWLGFFNGWTRKEAYMKAVGLGFYLPLDSFSVTLDPAAPARLIEVDGDPARAAEWSLLPIAAPDGYAAALVVRGDVTALKTWTWRHAERP
jgi:4'-phosphopantetheinyl transferase